MAAITSMHRIPCKPEALHLPGHVCLPRDIAICSDISLTQETESACSRRRQACHLIRSCGLATPHAWHRADTRLVAGPLLSAARAAAARPLCPANC